MPPQVEPTLWQYCVSRFQPAQPLLFLLPCGFSTLGIIFLCPRSSTPFPSPPKTPDARLLKSSSPSTSPELGPRPPLPRKRGGALRDSRCPAPALHPLCLPQGDTEVEMGENTQEDEFGLLTIHDVTRAHAGLYQCTADNGMAPPASAGVQLVVQCEFPAFIFPLHRGLNHTPPRIHGDTPTLRCGGNPDSLSVRVSSPA